MGEVMRFLWKKSEDRNKQLVEKKDLEPKLTPTVEIKSSNTKDSNDKTREYEIVERVIYPEKIICPDCGGFTLEGLDFCDKCGGEIYDMGEYSK